MTLNLLRGSHINLSLLVYAQLDGLLDFTKIPLVSPGIRTLVYEKYGQRNSWALHAQPGLYVAPAMNHYRCYTVYMIKTRSLRFTDTLTCFPSKVVTPVPMSTHRDILAANDLTIPAANDLTIALLNPSSTIPL